MTPTRDNWNSTTLPIDLICGQMRVTVVEEDGHPHKILPSEINMRRSCSAHLLKIIMELTAELCKSVSGYKAALKILHGLSCLMVADDAKQVRSCVDEIAKILGQFERKEKE
jgi:hypothetical protein